MKRKCGFCRKGGHNRLSCPRLKEAVKTVKVGAEKDLKWDVVKLLIVRVEQMEAKLLQFDIEMELVLTRLEQIDP